MKYNLDVLSPLEFEKLSKDIISKKLNLEFKSFKMGKDGGIDLRNKENGIICQCKHIKKFSDLKSILKKELELSCPLKRANSLYFVENKGIALSREKILNNVWNYDYFGDARTIDTHVKKLRKKMGEKGDYIRTIWGMGYKFEV